MHQQYLGLFWTLACCCCWRPFRTVSTSCPELTPKKPLRHLHPIYPLKIGRWKAGSQLPTQPTLRWTLHKLSYCHVEMLDEILSIFYTWRQSSISIHGTENTTLMGKWCVETNSTFFDVHLQGADMCFAHVGHIVASFKNPPGATKQRLQCLNVSETVVVSEYLPKSLHERWIWSM